MSMPRLQLTIHYITGRYNSAQCGTVIQKYLAIQGLLLIDWSRRNEKYAEGDRL